MTKRSERTARYSSAKQRGSSPADSKETLYRLQAEICRVLGHPRRLAILDLLAEGEKSTAALLKAVGASKVNLSQHLALMKHAGLVVSRQQGRQTFHRLAFPEIKDACQMTRDVLALRLQQTTRLARVLSRSRSFAEQPESVSQIV